MFAPTRPFSEDEWERVNTWLDRIYADFTGKVAAGPTLITVLFLCILSASGAIYLTLELSTPFDGLMQIPNDGLRNALK